MQLAMDEIARAGHIEVILIDGSYHSLSPRVLDVLLECNRIMKFKRTSGWVTVGIDPVRITWRDDDIPNPYNGPERRKNHH